MKILSLIGFTGRVVLFVPVCCFVAEVNFSVAICKNQAVQQTEKKIESYLKGIKYLSSDFIQKAADGSVFTGHIWISKEKGQKVRIDYSTGVNQRVFISNGVMRVINLDTNQESSHSLTQTPIYAILDKGLKLSDEKYEISFENEEFIYLDLKKSSIAGEMSVTLAFSKYKNGNIKNLLAWKVRDNSNSETSFSFFEDSLFVNDKSKIPNNTFK